VVRIAHVFNNQSTKRVCNEDDGAIPLNGHESNSIVWRLCVKLTASFLFRDNSLRRFIECSNKLFKDALPVRPMTFASYPNVRMRV
jgi:hypothetical protein